MNNLFQLQREEKVNAAINDHLHLAQRNSIYAQK